VRRLSLTTRGSGLLLAVALATAPTGAATAAAAPQEQQSRGRVLATGDSMIQLVDHSLALRVAPLRFKLRSDAHVGTGLSKPFQLDWVRHSRKQAARYRPMVSVVFLGANEGFPLDYDGRTVNCCSKRWVLAYADRAHAMMRALERDGRSHVYWLTMPAARPRQWNRIYRSVNSALRRAAAREPDDVTLIDTGAVFTPKGRFQQTIVYHGRRVSVRQADGIHLNATGASIAAGIVYRRMRRDGVFAR
jgi:hypothetical protein